MPTIMSSLPEKWHKNSEYSSSTILSMFTLFNLNLTLESAYVNVVWRIKFKMLKSGIFRQQFHTILLCYFYWKLNCEEKTQIFRGKMALFSREGGMWFLEKVSIFPGMDPVRAQTGEVLPLEVSLKGQSSWDDINVDTHEHIWVSCLPVVGIKR